CKQLMTPGWVDRSAPSDSCHRPAPACRTRSQGSPGPRPHRSAELEYVGFDEKTFPRVATSFVIPLLEWHDPVLRTVWTTLGAIATALGNLLFRRVGPMAELRPGDRAPDFALVGSDGRIYRLTDLIGRSVVVLAWFPKAYTAG